MKTDELIILWVGGLLSVFLLNERGAPSDLDIRTFGPAILIPWLVGVVTRVATIWILCGLVWITVYKRVRSKGKSDSTGEKQQEK